MTAIKGPVISGQLTVSSDPFWNFSVLWANRQVCPYGFGGVRAGGTVPGKMDRRGAMEGHAPGRCPGLRYVGFSDSR